MQKLFNVLKTGFVLISFLVTQSVYGNPLTHMADTFATIISTIFILMCAISIAIGMMIVIVYFVWDINIEFRRKK